MIILRFIVATIALVFVWFVVFVGVGWLIGILFQPRNGAQFLGIWLDWHGLPGLIIGLIMGIRAFRAIAAEPKKNARGNE